MKRSGRLKRALRVLVGVTLALIAWHFVRPFFRPKMPAPDAATLSHARNVRILRDTFGVPHVMGKTDADAAFGLAYAHAEDDWRTIQTVMAASKGSIALLLFGKKGIAIDYYANLVGAVDKGRAAYGELDDKTRALVDGYARGLNYYAYKHPGEADTRLLPFRGEDVVAGFVHKLSVMVGLPNQLESLGKGAPKHRGDRVTASLDPRLSPDSFPGSNAQALHRARSTDDVTRLNVNSHQPWEGPVAWYEAHVMSEEGWNMTGGTFPGAPLILHGHNDSIGWAHTVNSPDLVDTFEIRVDPKDSSHYLFDGASIPFETRDARITIDTGLFDLTIHKAVLSTKHGPAMERNGGMYAFRYAGMEHAGHAVEQWYRMNKATDLASWKKAMEVQAIPMFHTVFASRDDIYYVYNALLPKRAEGFDYSRVLPGDASRALFDGYLAFGALPAVHNPRAGFVQGCNSAPWFATSGDENPRADTFSPTFGIEAHMTNRALRSISLLGTGDKLDAVAFERMKWDRTYDRNSDIYRLVITPLTTDFEPKTDDERAAVALLRGWDGTTEPTSVAAPIAILAFKTLFADVRSATDPTYTRADDALRDAIRFLRGTFGRIDVPLGELQRLRRGGVDLPLGGGPDIMNAIYTRREGGKLLATQGDSYVLLVDFGPGGVTSRSVHQYGASQNPASPHYADQAPMFALRRLKPSWRTPAEIRAHLSREYAPGD